MRTDWHDKANSFFCPVLQTQLNTGGANYPFTDEAQTALFKDSVRTALLNTFHLGYKNQSVYAVNGTSRRLFSDKYKTHKY